jgi:hypothetical protein
MACTSSGIGCSPQPQGCPGADGCIPGVCPDFTLRRHDTKPDFKVKIDDCDGPLDLTDLILEATMWARGKLKSSMTINDTYFALADGIGFNQIMVGDIIIIDQARLPEKMLVTAFDEANRLIQVERGYHGSLVQSWKRGTSIRIMKFIGSPAKTEMIYQDVLEIDGTTTPNVLTDSFFVYEWGPNDTCLPGCYYLEFKLLKMLPSPQLIFQSSSIVPSFIDPNLTPSGFGCGLGIGVDWVRRFPLDAEGFYIKIVDSPTSEY